MELEAGTYPGQSLSHDAIARLASDFLAEPLRPVG